MDDHDEIYGQRKSGRTERAPGATETADRSVFVLAPRDDRRELLAEAVHATGGAGCRLMNSAAAPPVSPPLDSRHQEPVVSRSAGRTQIRLKRGMMGLGGRWGVHWEGARHADRTAISVASRVGFSGLHVHVATDVENAG